jgi:hypothetical protein
VIEDVELFFTLLSTATAAISPAYFLLPVADGEGGEPLVLYRERVYAYELYHQLRSIWPDNWQYSLAGEIDKRGHPIVRGEYLDNSKPDLLVHVPGRMDGNLVVLEIKPLRLNVNPAEQVAFQRDLQKLMAFRAIGYEAAIFFWHLESRFSEFSNTVTPFEKPGEPSMLSCFITHAQVNLRCGPSGSQEVESVHNLSKKWSVSAFQSVVCIIRRLHHEFHGAEAQA